MDNTNEILVGIDFGTTNTVITIFSNNKSNILVDGVFKTIPSKIGKINGKFYCGNYIPISCQNVIHSFKTSIGSDITFLFDDNEQYTHFNLLIIFFTHLKELIFKNLNTNQNNILIKAVITVPSNFNDKQREIIKKCFTAVNITIIRIINEPSAAALAYGLTQSSESEEKILVIDTGGGTMDFTILEKNDLFFEVIHSEGLNDLGGNNFTELIYNDIIKVKHLDVTQINKNILWNQAQKIKEKLTYLDYYECKINNLGENYKMIQYNLTKNKFINLTNNLITRVQETVNKIIQNYSNINYVVLVGGTSRISILQDTIKKIINKTPWIHPNLEHVVAEGAGLYAGIIENKYTCNEDVILMDVLPLSLGIELVDGTFSVIIPKNTPLPVKRSQKYTTDSPTESSVKVKVYQGERKIANKNSLIGEFVFDKVSIGGAPIIEISFKVDINSIINVIVIDKKTGTERNIIIKDIPNINTNDINNIIEQAAISAETDDIELSMIQNRYLIKTHIEDALANLQINDKINDKDRQNILDNLNLIEEKIETMDNLQLIETLTYLQNNFSILSSLHIEEDEDDNKYDNVEKLFLIDKKNELQNKITLLLVKNPDWEEFLKPVIEELSYNNITINYINDKLSLLEELENNYIDDTKDYKKEVNNLCLYLKSELENGTININHNNQLLIDLINNTLLLLNENNDNIDWKEQLDIFNLKCEQIYNNC